MAWQVEVVPVAEDNEVLIRAILWLLRLDKPKKEGRPDEAERKAS